MSTRTMSEIALLPQSAARFMVATLLALAASLPQAADDYPNKPVRFISPFSAGGGTDAVGRIIASRLSDMMGRSFVVDNRGGADGAIGTEIAAKSAPDGYTLLVANLGTFCMTPILRKTPYDPLRDFSYITQTTASASALVVHPSLPAKGLKDLVALVKAKPGEFNYGTSSNATALPMELLKMMTGMTLTRVSYKGTGPAIIGLLSGEVQVAFSGAIATVPHVRGGRLRALAVAGDKRARALPDVPTVAEQGYPGYEANSWNGIVAPAKTPRPIVDKLNTAIIKVLQMRDVREHMIADGAEPTHNTPEEFGALIASGHAKWTKVINAAGLKEKI